MMDGSTEHQIGIPEHGVLWQRGCRQVLDQLRCVHKHIVVHLHQQLGMRTLLVEPLESHDMLVGHVAIGVFEVTLDEIAVQVVLASQELLPLLALSAHPAHQEVNLQRRLVYIAPIRPRFSDYPALFDIAHCRMDQYQCPDILITGGLVY